MKQSVILILLVVFIVGCKNRFFYPNSFIRVDRHARFYHANYSKHYHYCIPEFRSCHYTELRGNALAMSSGKIFFRRDSVEHTIQNAYRRFFNVSGQLPLEPTFFDRKCFTPSSLYSETLDAFRFESTDICENVILPTLIIISNSGKHIDGGGGMEPAEDMGDDKHLLEYKLTTAIYQNDTLIYMDNRTHWTSVISERDEQLTYHVPQVIIDSLVTLTLQEYFKRME